MSFWMEYGPVIAFYLVVGLIIYLNRKRFDIENGFIAMYRTKIGIKSMHWFGDRFPKVIRFFGVVGVVVGFAGMALIVVTVAKGLWDLLFTPGAPPTVAPIIPGVPIPGLGLKVPLIAGLIAIFVSVVIHEYCHGIVAASYKMRIKSSGFVMFGPLPGAFVEPDEKQLFTRPAKQQLSVFAAGPFSNIILAFLIIFLFGFAPQVLFNAGFDAPTAIALGSPLIVYDLPSARTSLYHVEGMRVDTVAEDSAIEAAGVRPGMVITALDGVTAEENASAFISAMQNTTPGQVVEVQTDQGAFTVTLGENPDDSSRGYFGLRDISEDDYLIELDPERVAELGRFRVWIIESVFELVLWIFLISLGLGLANLLPLGPVDGGRMFLLALMRFLPKKKAEAVWAQTAKVLLILIVILLIVPILRSFLPF